MTRRKNIYTDMGQGRGVFPETSLGLVNAIQNPDLPEHREAVERLCQYYWTPTYRFIFPWWTQSNEDAKDLTQSFLLWLMESGALGSYDPEKGRFRTFVKVLLRRFLSRQAKAQSRLKRGGGINIVSLDEKPGLTPESDAGSAEEAFDAALLGKLLEDAVAYVRERYAARGRERCVTIFEEYDLVERDDRPTYAVLAKRHDVGEGDVRNYLFSVRDAVRNRMRAQFALMTPSPDSLEDEWRDLVGDSQE